MRNFFLWLEPMPGALASHHTAIKPPCVHKNLKN
jgi:hypothetical protein